MTWVLILVAVFMLAGLRNSMTDGARHSVAIVAAGAMLAVMFLQFPR